MIIEITEKELKLLIRLLKNKTHPCGDYDWFRRFDDRDSYGERMSPKLQKKLLSPNIKTIKIIANPTFEGEKQFQAFPVPSNSSLETLVDKATKSIIAKSLGRSITIDKITDEGIFYRLGEPPKKEWEN